ncbi:hypothetical protein GCM10009783_26050 [Glycomyces lechevalierae]
MPDSSGPISGSSCEFIRGKSIGGAVRAVAARVRLGPVSWGSGTRDLRGEPGEGTVTVHTHGRDGHSRCSIFVRVRWKFIRPGDAGPLCRKAVTPRKGHAVRKPGPSVIEM